MRKQTVVLIGAFLGLSIASLTAFQTPQVVLDVQNGTKTLECEFTDGFRAVDGSKVVGIDDVSNRWIFTNGSVATRNCTVN